MSTSSKPPDSAASDASSSTPAAPTPQQESAAFSRLTGDTLAGLTEAVQTSHEQVSAIVDAVIPTRIRPWRKYSAATTRGVYEAVKFGVKTLPPAVHAVSSAVGKDDVMAPSNNGFVRGTQATMNGLWPTMTDDRPELVTEMAVRIDHADLALTPDAIAVAFPEASGRIAIFVHGMVCDEDCWIRPEAAGATTTDSEPSPTTPATDATDATDATAATAATESAASKEHVEPPEPVPYGTRLQSELGITPVYVRYHTGRSVADNGRDLADLIEALVAGWPVPVENVSLVAHSMGGLVSVVAATRAHGESMTWYPLLDHVITLGTPHHGAPLAHLMCGTGPALSGVPVVGPIAEWAQVTSAGGADLRKDLHAEGLPADATPRLPLTAISATKFGSREQALMQHAGDLLVPTYSADASAAEAMDVTGHHVERAGHLALLNHPDVYAHIRETLESRSAAT